MQKRKHSTGKEPLFRNEVKNDPNHGAKNVNISCESPNCTIFHYHGDAYVKNKTRIKIKKKKKAIIQNLDSDNLEK